MSTGTIFFLSLAFASHSAAGDINEKFMKACRYGEKSKVENYLANPFTKFFINKNGTALHGALEFGNEDVADLLLDYGACNVHVFDCNDRSPLQIAVENRLKDTVERLLESGASVTAVKISKTPYGENRTPLQLGATYGDEETMSLLLGKIDGSRVDSTEFTNDGTTLLRVALTRRNEGAVWALVKAGCDDDFTLDELDFALHAAAETQGEAVMNYLLRKLGQCRGGADPAEIAKKKGTSLRTALVYNNVGAARALVNGGCDVFAPDEHFNTPLHFVAGKEGAQLLLEKNVPLEAKNDEGETPFRRKFSFGHTEAAEAILAAGGDVDAVDFRGNSAVHSKASFYIPEKVEWLARKGANMNLANFAGMKPLDVCNSRTGKVLIEYGADIAGYDPVEMMRNFWKRSVLKSPDETFDDFFMRIADAENVNGSTNLLAYVELRTLALYRVLKAMYPGNETCHLQNKKNVLSRKIWTKLTEGNVFEEVSKKSWRPNFEPDLSSEYYKWKIELLSFYLAFKAHKSNTDVDEAFPDSEISRFIDGFM